MKKIMFNEHYGLETATLNGSKTRTSRIITVNSICEKFIDCLNRDSEVELTKKIAKEDFKIEFNEKYC